MKSLKFLALSLSVAMLCSFLGAKEHKNEPQRAKFRHKSHASSSSSDSLESKIDRLNHNAGKCCKRIVHELHELDKKAGCDEVHVISSVPAVIDHPGKWCVKNDLVYNGQGAAITITADNVTLNFYNHSLTLTNPAAVGLYAEGVQEITVENDIIQSTNVSTDPSSHAFYFVNCEKVKLDNIFTANTFFGVQAVNCNDVFVTHSRFKDHIGGGGTIDLYSGAIRADTCSSVVIEDSTFSGAGIGRSASNTSVQTIFRDGSTNCRISNCEFDGIEGAVLGYGVAGLVIEGCITQTAARAADPSLLFTPVIQLGGFEGTQLLATDVTVRNCLLNGNVVFDYAACNPENADCIPPLSEGVFQVAISIAQSSMILIDNCEIGNFLTYKIFNDLQYQSGVIQSLANSENVRPHDITIRGCMIRGNSEFFGSIDPNGYNQFYGIFCLRTDNLVIDNCALTAIPVFPIAVGLSTNTVIRDSIIEGGGDAIWLRAAPQDVTIINNQIIGVGGRGILMSSEEGGAKNVVVEGNVISDTGLTGIFMEQTENVILKNNIIDGAISGVSIVTGSKTAIVGNTISNSGYNGLELVFATNTLVENNSFDNNGLTETLGPWSGIIVVGSSKTDIVGNSCNANGAVGIGIVEGSTDTIIRNNTLTNSGFNGLEIVSSSNTTVQDNVCNYNGQVTVWEGILVIASSKTDLIGNSCSGNTEGGIVIAGGSTDTFMENNITTHNPYGIYNVDAPGEVTAFFNTSCDNDFVNCFNIPLMQLPGDTTYISGANVCCSDPAPANAQAAEILAKNKLKASQERDKFLSPKNFKALDASHPVLF